MQVCNCQGIYVGVGRCGPGVGFIDAAALCEDVALVTDYLDPAALDAASGRSAASCGAMSALAYRTKQSLVLDVDDQE